MKTIFFFLGLALLSSCAHKVERLDTRLEYETPISFGTTLGVRDGELVVQRKTNMAEKLRDLQIEVYALEVGVYGSDELGNRGTFGVLKDCRKDKAKITGELEWNEPRDFVTHKEEPLRVGFDERQVLIGMSEEKLQARLDRFAEYKSVLSKRQDDLRLKLDKCEIDTMKVTAK